MAPKTISRWERRLTECPVYLQAALRDPLISGTRSELGTEEFAFIDLFAGIGGMRIGFEQASGCCVFTTGWNRCAQKIYADEFETDRLLPTEYKEVETEESPLPSHAVEGFPCELLTIGLFWRQLKMPYFKMKFALAMGSFRVDMLISRPYLHGDPYRHTDLKLDRTWDLETFNDLTVLLTEALVNGDVDSRYFQDSRSRMDIVLEWANQFNARHLREKWESEEYLDAIESWFHTKVKERYSAARRAKVASCSA